MQHYDINHQVSKHCLMLVSSATNQPNANIILNCTCRNLRIDGTLIQGDNYHTECSSTIYVP